MTGTGSLPGDDALEADSRGPADSGDPVDPGDFGDFGDPADPEPELPDLPLFALLRTVEHEIGAERIDRIWLFPPRRLKAGETAVVVVTAYPDTHDDRRRVYAAHYTAPAARAEPPRLALDEFGTAPADRVGRLVEEAVERFKDDAPPQPPRPFTIEGDENRWKEMLFGLAQELVESEQESWEGRGQGR